MTPIRHGLLVGIVVLLSGVWSSAEALRCGQRLVFRGDTQLDVVFKCGEPTSVATWEETILVFVEDDHPIQHRRSNKLHSVGKSVGHRVIVTEVIQVEEWTYNRGPHNLIYILRFHNGRFANVKTGGYGY